MTDQLGITDPTGWSVEQAEATLDAALVNYRQTRQGMKAATGTFHFAFAMCSAMGPIEKALHDLRFAWFRDHAAAEEARRLEEQKRR